MGKVEITPTDEQQAISDKVAKLDTSLMVEAYAGCAKTSTLVMSAPGVREAALMIGFNKSTVQEIAPQLPGNFTSKTANGLGHGAWIRANPQVFRMELDDRKLGKLVTKVIEERKIKLTSEQWDQARKLVTGAMQAGITPQDQGEPLKADNKENWAQVFEGDQEDFELIYDLAHQVMEESVQMARAGKISFDDQIYCSVCLGGKFAQFPIVFNDESQDMNRLNHTMIAKSLRADGRLVAVGDPRQSIYVFRGADSRSMETMRVLSAEWTDLPLTITFRCPKVVVARQQDHAPGFRAWHTNTEGLYKSLYRKSLDQSGDLEGGWSWKDLIGALPNPQVNPTILCRNNGPLLGMAFKLLRQGIGVVMLGRDIGKGLIALSKKIAKSDSTPAAQVMGAIHEWMENQIALAKAADQPHKEESIRDKAECLIAVLESASCRDAGDLRTMLEKLFSREAGKVTLSSIHRAKGLEWDCVLILDPWRIPSKWAKKAAAQGDTRQLEQEWNLRYVCETRTKHTLLTADLEGFR